MTRTFYMAGLLAATLTFAASATLAADAVAPVPSDMAARYAHSKWTKPTDDQMNAVYPSEAQADRTEGTVKLDCYLTATGGLTNCTVLSEFPKGYGFGKAAIGLFENHVTVDPTTVTGGLQPGDHKVFSFKFFQLV